MEESLSNDFKQLAQYDCNLQLCIACKSGNMTNAQYLIDTDKHRLDVTIYKNYPFRAACEFGHLDIAKLLLRVFNRVDVTADDNYAFKQAAQNGHSGVVDFLLLEYGSVVNPAADDNFAIKHATKNKHYNISETLANTPSVYESWDFISEELDEDIPDKRDNCDCFRCVII